jgi:hypothetical protein
LPHLLGPGVGQSTKGAPWKAGKDRSLSGLWPMT